MNIFHKHKFEIKKIVKTKETKDENYFYIYWLKQCKCGAQRWDFKIILYNFNLLQPKPKIYCKNCKWFGLLTETAMISNDCIHCKNLKLINTPYQQEKEIIIHYNEINKNNDCAWFEPKEKPKKKAVK